jgi:hypothetical protein
MIAWFSLGVLETPILDYQGVGRLKASLMNEEEQPPQPAPRLGLYRDCNVQPKLVLDTVKHSEAK